MAAFPPGPEVGTELVFAKTETLQFSLHQPASLQHLVPITQVALLWQGHIEANGAAMAGHLNRRGRFQMGGQPGPEFTDANTGRHAFRPPNVYTS